MSYTKIPLSLSLDIYFICFFEDHALCATFSRFFGSTVVFCMCVVLFLRIFTRGGGSKAFRFLISFKVPCEVDDVFNAFFNIGHKIGAGYSCSGKQLLSVRHSSA